MQKKILFDVGHPAQVHQFKHLFWKLREEGWEGLFTVKDKEIAIELLDKLKLPYRVIGKNEKGIANKLFKLPVQIKRFNKVVKDFKPDLILSRFSIHAAYVARFKGIPNIGFADTEHTTMLDKLTDPLISCKLTAYSYEKQLSRNHIRYHGNIELFYLHPKLFIPDLSILNYLGVEKGQKYAIIRFVSWDAHHDVGHEGLSIEFKKELVESLAKHIRVFITSEKQLSPELENYRIQIPVEKIHDALAFAHLYIGEGGTMASEAACLGTPSIYINQLEMGYLKEEAANGLLKNFKSTNGLIDEAMSIINNDLAKTENKERLNKFLSEQINVTEFLKWFIIDFPESMAILKENPDYQLKFRN